MKLISLAVMTFSLSAFAADPEAFDVKFKVSDGKAVLLSGSAVAARRPIIVEHHGEHSAELLTLEVEPREDGRALVHASWADHSAKGDAVKWEPVALVARGQEVELHFDYAGGSRTLALTVAK